MAFVGRTITLTFRLGKGATFEESGSSTYTISGLRMQVKISKAGGDNLDTADLQIYGISLPVAKKLCSLSPAVQTDRQNTVMIQVGDVGGVLATAFEGQIVAAQLNLNSQPDVSLAVSARAGYLLALQPAPVYSKPGAMDAAKILKDLATAANLEFENSQNLSQMVRGIYYEGTYRDQIAACLSATKWASTIDQGANGKSSGTLAIWPRNGARGGHIVPVISEKTGLIGYPDFANFGIVCRCLYNPGLIFGGPVEVQSSIDVLTGKWAIFGLTHNLETQTPNGAWFTEFLGLSFGATQ